MKKYKGIVIDSDFLIFEVTEGAYIKNNTFANEKVDLAPFKERFDELVGAIHDEVSVALLGTAKVGKKIKLIFSDPETNFRYKLYPEYKANRKGSTRSDLFYRMRKWALKKYSYVKNIEADDQMQHWGKKGYIICSMDKDVLKALVGTHFDVYHSRRHIVETSEYEAMRFTHLQTLMGDPVDGIRALPRVGEKTAIKLLDEHGWTWEGVVKSYESKGLTEKDAILTRRLVDMTQWSPKKGVKLWKPKK